MQNLFKVSSKDTRKQAYLVHIPIVCFEQVIAWAVNSNVSNNIEAWQSVLKNIESSFLPNTEDLRV